MTGFSLPLTTVQERFTGNDRVTMISVQAKSVELINQAKEEVTAVIRKRHRNQDNFFNVWEMRAGMEQLFKISQSIKIVLGVIAGIFTTCGWHRHYEHDAGLCNGTDPRNRLTKSGWRQESDILLQFLVEAIALCSVGGLIVLGWGLLLGTAWQMLR